MQFKSCYLFLSFCGQIFTSLLNQWIILSTDIIALLALNSFGFWFGLNQYLTTLYDWWQCNKLCVKKIWYTIRFFETSGDVPRDFQVKLSVVTFITELLRTDASSDDLCVALYSRQGLMNIIFLKSHRNNFFTTTRVAAQLSPVRNYTAKHLCCHSECSGLLPPRLLPTTVKKRR